MAFAIYVPLACAQSMSSIWWSAGTRKESAPERSRTGCWPCVGWPRRSTSGTSLLAITRLMASAIIDLAIDRQTVAERRLGVADGNIAQSINKLFGHGDTPETVPPTVPPKNWAVKKRHGTPRKTKPARTLRFWRVMLLHGTLQNVILAETEGFEPSIQVCARMLP